MLLIWILWFHVWFLERILRCYACFRRDICSSLYKPSKSWCCLLHSCTLQKIGKDAQLDCIVYWLVLLLRLCFGFRWSFLMRQFLVDWKILMMSVSQFQVAIKTLIVIHRTLREGDPTFREEMVHYSQRGNLFQISNFKDDSSPLGIPTASTVYLSHLCRMIQLVLVQHGIVLLGYVHMRCFWRKDWNVLGQWTLI